MAPGLAVVYLNGEFATQGYWSYRAFVAAHWASRDPGRAVGAVLVDGAVRELAALHNHKVG